MALYAKIRRKANSELMYVWLSKMLLILMSVVIKSWALVFIIMRVTTLAKVSLCILEVWDTLIEQEWIEVLVFYTNTEV